MATPPIGCTTIGSAASAVVLIHPLGMDRHFWDPLTQALATEQACVLVELPGHGQAPPAAGSYTIGEVAAGLEDALDAAEHERYDLIGCSMGAMVALCHARQQPRRVRRMVLANTTARYAEPLRVMWTERAQVARSAGMAAVVDELLPVWFGDATLADDGPAVQYVRERLATMDPHAYALACEALREADLRRHLEKVGVPTLVVAGPEDVLAPDCAELAAALPDARLHTLPGGRHGAALEYAGVFTTLAINFLRGRDDPEGGGA